MGGCTSGQLDVTYRRVRVTYTFSLRRHTHCAPDGFETAAENGFARIYSLEGSPDGERATTYFACRFDSGRYQNLGRDYCCYYSGEDFFDDLVLVDEKVAYVTGFYDTRYGIERRFYLRVLDMATFSIQREIYMDTANSTDEDQDITGVVLKTNGSVAWILGRWLYPSYTWTYEVRKGDETGSNVLVESGSDIDPASLTLSGSTLTWVRAGETRSATLN